MIILIIIGRKYESKKERPLVYRRPPNTFGPDFHKSITSKNRTATLGWDSNKCCFMSDWTGKLERMWVGVWVWNRSNSAAPTDASHVSSILQSLSTSSMGASSVILHREIIYHMWFNLAGSLVWHDTLILSVHHIWTHSLGYLPRVC